MHIFILILLVNFSFTTAKAQGKEVAGLSGTAKQVAGLSGTESDSTAQTPSAVDLSESENSDEEAYEASATAERPVPPGGSFHRIDRQTLARLRLDDPLRILAQVPGVYTRTEDGWGLRPNIGLRGATPERSRSITLMEDGILLAPAAYSAPAAYYFPLMMRMDAVEVAMGSASIPYGPHTVGGSVNLVNRQIPTRAQGGIDLAFGSTEMGKLNFHFGDGNRWGGFLVEFAHLRSRGFHQIDRTSDQRDQDTGFARTDVQARGALFGELFSGVRHRIEAVAGLGLEQSNETYVGLTDADFRAHPTRRYLSTALDRMEWWRTRAELRYRIEWQRSQVELVLYRNDFSRVWRRMNNFRDGTDFTSVLTQPTGANSVYADILRGSEDTTLAGQDLVLNQNGRVFFSEGIQLQARTQFTTGDVGHRVFAGVRLHWDAIERTHLAEGYRVENRNLTRDQVPTETILRNRASAFALAGFISYEMMWKGLRIAPGIRSEWITGDLVDRLSGAESTNEQRVFTPGIGIEYEVVFPFSVFAGVHQGFSPVAPGQDPSILPEVSWNYELGARYGQVGSPSYLQAVYFVNDYSNLLATCSGGGGCPVEFIDRQFNAGSVLLLGLEGAAAHRVDMGEVHIPLRGSYTYTYTRFASDFISDNPQYGDVKAGYRLPYVPEHQFALSGGIEWRMLRLMMSANYVGSMLEVAAIDPNSLRTDEYATLDANITARVVGAPDSVTGQGRGLAVDIYLRAENITNSQPLVSRRPFGARGIRPFMMFGGVQMRF